MSFAKQVFNPFPSEVETFPNLFVVFLSDDKFFFSHFVTTGCGSQAFLLSLLPFNCLAGSKA